MYITRTQKEFVNFEIKTLVDYHDLYVERGTLLLADVFANFRNMCLEIHKLDPALFHTSIGLAGKAVLKKHRVKLDFITDIDLLLMVEEAEYAILFIDMLKLITNT